MSVYIRPSFHFLCSTDEGDEEEAEEEKEAESGGDSDADDVAPVAAAKQETAVRLVTLFH